VSRRDFRTALVGGIIGALVVGVLTPVGAAIGDVMKVGRANTADATTTIRGSSAATLNLVQQDPTGKAMRLKGPGAGNKVKRLNADRLDGLSSTAFLRAGAQANDSDEVDGFDANGLVRVAHAETFDVNETTVFGGNHWGDILSTQVTAPTPGLLFMVGGAESWLGSSSAYGDIYICMIRVNRTEVIGSGRHVQVAYGDPPHIYNGEEDCSTNGVQEVSAGTHTVDLRVTHRGTSAPQAMFQDASLQVLFVPFGADGTQPSP
jgi:hypothetical protein